MGSQESKGPVPSDALLQLNIRHKANAAYKFVDLQYGYSWSKMQR